MLRSYVLKQNSPVYRVLADVVHWEVPLEHCFLEHAGTEPKNMDIFGGAHSPFGDTTGRDQEKQC